MGNQYGFGRLMLLVALIVTVGIGTCPDNTEWCNSPTGKISLYQPLITDGCATVGVGFDHFSRIGDGELRRRGDRGVDVYSLQFSFNISSKRCWQQMTK